MRVWFYPVEAPDVYVIVRPDAENTIVCLSDGLTFQRVLEAAALLATREERDWVRRYIGAPTVGEDPTFARADDFTEGDTWDRSMIPEGLLWAGKVPCGEHKEAAEREVAGNGTPA